MFKCFFLKRQFNWFVYIFHTFTLFPLNPITEAWVFWVEQFPIASIVSVKPSRVWTHFQVFVSHTCTVRSILPVSIYFPSEWKFNDVIPAEWPPSTLRHFHVFVLQTRIVWSDVPAHALIMMALSGWNSIRRTELSVRWSSDATWFHERVSHICNEPPSLHWRAVFHLR